MAADVLQTLVAIRGAERIAVVLGGIASLVIGGWLLRHAPAATSNKKERKKAGGGNDTIEITATKDYTIRLWLASPGLGCVIGGIAVLVVALCSRSEYVDKNSPPAAAVSPPVGETPPATGSPVMLRYSSEERDQLYQFLSEVTNFDVPAGDKSELAAKAKKLSYKADDLRRLKMFEKK